MGMTPQEKAESLTIGFALLTKDYSSAKASAIIVCNGIIDEYKILEDDKIKFSPHNVSYWEKVKIKIGEL